MVSFPSLSHFLTSQPVFLEPNKQFAPESLFQGEFCGNLKQDVSENKGRDVKSLGLAWRGKTGSAFPKFKVRLKHLQEAFSSYGLLSDIMANKFNLFSLQQFPLSIFVFCL